MNIACPLTHLFTTRYCAVVDKGMIEHELVHCFGGLYAGEVRPNPLEADGYAWMSLDELRQEVDRVPARYSPWFRLYLRDHWPEITGSAEAHSDGV
jgi:isopentenyl-diphosphate delta-isomerase